MSAIIPAYKRKYGGLKMIYIGDVITLLARNFKNYDLSIDEFLVLNGLLTNLNNNLNHRKTVENIAQTTSKTIEEVNSILNLLVESEKLPLDEKYMIQLDELYYALNRAEREAMSLIERIKRAKRESYQMGGYGEFPHMGMVELGVNTEKGICIQDNEGFIWNRKMMKELAHEIIEFVNHYDDEDIEKYNKGLQERKEREAERRKRELQERQKQKEEARLPVNGNIIIFKIPNGYYKFSYSTQLSVSTKIVNLKEQYGDHIQIIHSIEVHDTMKFYHQFLKKQFTNRAVDKQRNSEYDLTQEDIEFIKNEKYPSNAMEWAFGTVTTGNEESKS
ncbi:hypothetical protein RGU12_10065 [Fredinandcohnia sp. QZ13]|uniref:hypothetical protein n=1 Tax=Fredinandcohnia sp. QZ13 TaxID=3073144 RepID=UPI0028530E71|nr:hypothetical protein [Fredinandcohnia sp. QZ13]MDR4887892.1 hypothetical protein [Fredinandcohnia sp. QZ13]